MDNISNIMAAIGRVQLSRLEPEFIPARRETILPEGTYIVQYRLGGTSRTGKNIAVKISSTIKHLPCPTKKGEEQGRLS